MKCHVLVHKKDLETKQSIAQSHELISHHHPLYDKVMSLRQSDCDKCLTKLLLRYSKSFQGNPIHVGEITYSHYN